MIDLAEGFILRAYTSRYLIGRRRLDYQPLPWVRINTARRATGTVDRMHAIEAFLSARGISGNVALDVGCNVGFFSLSLQAKGFFVYGVDADRKSLTIAQIASRSVESGAFIPVEAQVDPQTVRYLPAADVGLCLSVWHHWVRQYGREEATNILKVIFSQTRHVLFFDTGEADATTADYGLSFMEPDAREWLRDYLTINLEGSDVTWLGAFKAFEAGRSEEDSDVKRNLFAAVRRL